MRCATVKVGVVLAPRPVGPEPDYEAQDRNSAFVAAGWDVRPASDWSARELVERLSRQPSTHHQHRDQQDDGTIPGEPHR